MGYIVFTALEMELWGLFPTPPAFVISNSHWNLMSVIPIGIVVKMFAFQEPAINKFASGKCGFVISFQVI